MTIEPEIQYLPLGQVFEEGSLTPIAVGHLQNVKVFHKLIGKVLTQINIGSPCFRPYVWEYRETITFIEKDGSRWKMGHPQDCCEDVYIESIDGTLRHLLGEIITMAEVFTHTEKENDSCDESQTWSFYKFGTRLGSVTIRWVGRSNGYYSEEVEFKKYRIKRKTTETSKDMSHD
jgi:hypothetical protein